jgi:hypothetical protein
VKKWTGLSAVLFLLGMTGLSTQALGYEAIQVSSGGTIMGKVTLNGPIPPPRVFPLVLYPFGPFCKKISDGKGHILLEEFIVGPEGGMQDAIVAVQKVGKGKPFTPIKGELETVDCMFHPVDVPDDEQFRFDESGKLRHAHPLVSVIQNPQEISVINKDPILHNGQVFQSEKGNIILNFPLPISDEPRGGIVHLEPGKRVTQMICGMHEFMQTWGFVVENPYYAKTRRDGTFVIDQLPPGTYKVIAWHPHLKMIEQAVIIPASGTVSLNFEFDSHQVQRPHYESQEKFRIGPEALPHEHLEGCEAPYCSSPTED